MKKSIFLCLLFFSIFPLFCESESVADVEDNQKCSIIIHRDGILDTFNYQFLDGKKISSSELDRILINVEGNKGLIAKKNLWQGATWCLAGCVCSSIAINWYAYDKGWSNMVNNSIACGIGAFCAMYLSSTISQGYRAKAVDNYNLYVMGIKIQ
ncbi:MAG: hypothetical protein IKS30_01540 [Treponema sp.]|nr:hypothetical protein [Treponema sp.]